MGEVNHYNIDSRYYLAAGREGHRCGEISILEETDQICRSAKHW